MGLYSTNSWLIQHWIPEQRTRDKHHDRGFCARTGQLAKVTEELEYKKQPKTNQQKIEREIILKYWKCIFV